MSLNRIGTSFQTGTAHQKHDDFPAFLITSEVQNCKGEGYIIYLYYTLFTEVLPRYPSSKNRFLGLPKDNLRTVVGRNIVARYFTICLD